MSIVSFKWKYIFIKTRKTAGTSVQSSLLDSCGPNDIVSSGWTNLLTGQKGPIEEFASLNEIMQTHQIDLKDFYSFGFTRNPFAITLSRYFFQVGRGRITGPPTKKGFNNWVEEIYFLGEPGFTNGRFIKDRSRYLLFDTNFKPLVKFIGKYETLESDFRYIVKKIGIPEVSLVHINKSNTLNIDYRDWIRVC